MYWKLVKNIILTVYQPIKSYLDRLTSSNFIHWPIDQILTPVLAVLHGALECPPLDWVRHSVASLTYNDARLYTQFPLHPFTQGYFFSDSTIARQTDTDLKLLAML